MAINALTDPLEILVASSRSERPAAVVAVGPGPVASNEHQETEADG